MEEKLERGRPVWRSWFRRGSVAATVPAPRPASGAALSEAEAVAQYRRVVQSVVDGGYDATGATVHVCGVGPMLITVDDEGRVKLERSAAATQEAHPET